MFNLIIKNILETNLKDNFKELIVWTDCTLKNNHLIITRELKKSGLYQVYVCDKSASTGYLKDIQNAGRFDYAFRQYNGMKNIRAVYDSIEYGKTGEVKVSKNFSQAFGRSANKWVEVANQITGYNA